MPEQPRPVLVVDLGAQYAQLIARRGREAHVYSEIVPHDLDAKGFAAKRPSGSILSGGPAGVHEARARVSSGRGTARASGGRAGRGSIRTSSGWACRSSASVTGTS